MKLWIARDIDDFLYLYSKEPKLSEKVDGIWVCGQYGMPVEVIALPPGMFPEVTFENSPQLVELKLVKEEQSMKTFYVEVDTNDADYVGKLVDIEDEDAEKWMPLIEKIKNFKTYSGVSKHEMVWKHHHNFPIGECCRCDLGEKDPCELYNITEDELEEFIETFRLYGSEYGFHTITEISEINIVKRIL